MKSSPIIGMSEYIIGIDEAGRGPLAGPVSVGIVCTPKHFNWQSIPGVDDSKKLTEKKREAVYELAQALKEAGELDFAVVMISAKVIDSIGIVPAINRAMKRALGTLTPLPHMCEVKLDGSLKAPEEYTNQETIIGGDGKEEIIGLASIVAKVTRDRYMKRISTKPQYDRYAFEIHKGYGTKRHRDAIAKFGVCDIHRKSFCTKLLKS